MSGKIKFLIIFAIIYLNIDTILSVCTQGVNCPSNQGFCNPNECSCYYGYKTFITDNETNPIYCNYVQTNRFIPFFLEMFFPPIGLLYIGRIFHALIKAFGLLSVILVKFGSKNLIFILGGFLFVILLFADLIFLITGFYVDGNGVELL